MIRRNDGGIAYAFILQFGTPDYLNKYFDDTTRRYDLWLAQWPNKPDFDNPPAGAGIWQYTSKGKVSGINGNVDMDAAYVDYPAVIKAAGLNGLNANGKPWFDSAQEWVKATGISDGINPDAAVTKAEVWDMLYKAIGR